MVNFPRWIRLFQCTLASTFSCCAQKNPAAKSCESKLKVHYPTCKELTIVLPVSHTAMYMQKIFCGHLKQLFRSYPYPTTPPSKVGEAFLQPFITTSNKMNFSLQMLIPGKYPWSLRCHQIQFLFI